MRVLPPRKTGCGFATFPRSLNPRYQVVAHALQPWWYEFHARWSKCVRCPLQHFRSNVVHFRGIIPAPVLFIGEAPGESENELGRPFVGEAGKTLDHLLDEAGLEDGDYCITNTVACLPWDTDKNTFRIPVRKEIKQCSPRLQEFTEKVNPSLIVLLGNIAANSLPNHDAPNIRLMHPSAINRGGKKPIDVKRFVLTLKLALEKLKR